MAKSEHPDRFRRAPWALLGTFVLAGHAVLSPVAWFPEFVARLGVDYATWGSILGLSAAGAIGALSLAAPLQLRFGSRPVMRMSLVLALGALVLLAFAAETWVWAVVHIGFTFSFTLFGNSVNVQAVLLQSRIQRPIIGRVHAGWSVGALLAAGTGAISTVSVPIEWYFAGVAIASLVGFEILRPHLLGPHEDGHEFDRGNHLKRRFGSMPPRLWVLSFGLVAAVFPELAIVDWATIYAEKELGVGPGWRAIPFAVFMMGMIVARLSLTSLVERFSASKVAAHGAMAAGVCMLVTVLSSGFVAPTFPGIAMMVFISGWFLVGIGMGAVAPTFFAAASTVPDISTAWALSRMQLVVQFSLIGLKTMMGVLAETTSLPFAFFLPAGLLVAAAFIARYGRVDTPATQSLESFTPGTGSIVLPALPPFDPPPPENSGSP